MAFILVQEQKLFPGCFPLKCFIQHKQAPLSSWYRSVFTLPSLRNRIAGQRGQPVSSFSLLRLPLSQIIGKERVDTTAVDIPRLLPDSTAGHCSVFSFLLSDSCGWSLPCVLGLLGSYPGIGDSLLLSFVPMISCPSGNWLAKILEPWGTCWSQDAPRLHGGWQLNPCPRLSLYFSSLVYRDWTEHKATGKGQRYEWEKGGASLQP